MSQQNDDFVVPPAPPGTPAEPKSPTVSQSQPTADESDYISLPPGMETFDSATYKVESPRRSAPPAESSEPPAFFPVGAPGLPATPPVPDQAGVPTPSSTPVVQSEIDDRTMVAPRRHGAAPWRLILPSGAEVSLSHSMLLGRAPSASANWPGAELLPLNDPRKSVSKTHAALALDSSGGLKIHDLGSTNGVWVSYPNGDEFDAEPGDPVILEDGATVHLGEFELTLRRD